MDTVIYTIVTILFIIAVCNAIEAVMKWIGEMAETQLEYRRLQVKKLEAELEEKRVAQVHDDANGGMK